MSRQPITGLLLLFVAVAGAFATHGSQSLNSQPTAKLQPARKLDPEAAARARAEWEEVLRTANVRLMAFERINEQSTAATSEGRHPSAQEPGPGIAGPRHATGDGGQMDLLPAEMRQQTTPPKSSPVGAAARKSGARAIARNQAKAAEPWTFAFDSRRR